MHRQQPLYRHGACLLFLFAGLVGPVGEAGAVGMAIAGALQNSAGGPVTDGKYGLSVTLYAVDPAQPAAPPTTVYEQAFVGVDVALGRFSVVLGEGAAAQPFDGVAIAGQTTHIGVSIDGDPELPLVGVRPVLRAWLADKALFADNAGHAATADQATSADDAQQAALAQQALKADAAATAEELACTGCIGLVHLGADVKSGFVPSSGGTVSGKLTVTGGADLAGSVLSGARLAEVDVDNVPCDASRRGEVALGLGTNALYFCAGDQWRKLAGCQGICPDASEVLCGAPVLSDCAEPCGGTGTLCAAGSCVAGQCKLPGADANVPAASCQAIKDGGFDAAGSGRYWLDPDGAGPGQPFEAWCEMALDGGGWTLALNLDTSDGHVMWWANELWTNAQPYGDVAAPWAFTGDIKSPAWTQLAGATKVLLVVHEDGQIIGWRSFAKADGDTLEQVFDGGDNVLLGASSLAADTANIWAGERLVRLSTKLYANHCINQGSACTSNSGSGSSDGDRLASDEAKPQSNFGGGLGNWHDMAHCCPGSLGGKPCSGSAIRTASEAQAGWSKCYTADPSWGTFGTDSHAPMTNACGNNDCSKAAWAQPNGKNYDYALYLGGTAAP